MNVILISDYGYVDGGISHVLVDSIRLLDGAGIPVTLICGTERVDRGVFPANIKIISLGMYDLISDPNRGRAMRNGIWNGGAAKRVGEILKEYDPKDTVVHVHSWSKIFSPSLFAALRKSGFKTFLTCHDYFVACPNGAFYDYVKGVPCHRKGASIQCLTCNCDSRKYVHKVWRWVRHQFISRQLKRFKGLRLITISDCNDKLVRKGLGEGLKYIRLNNSIKVEKGAENSIVGKKDFFFVGRASTEKGLGLFADAVGSAGEMGVVLGDGLELARIKASYPMLDCLGWKSPEEVVAITRERAAVFVFSSLLYEGSPLTPLEMMALNVPCIIADETSAAEYIEDGKTGLLFKLGDVEDLKRKIEMMKDPDFREQMSENIRKYFDISKWSEETHITKLLAAYREALEEVNHE